MTKFQFFCQFGPLLFSTLWYFLKCEHKMSKYEQKIFACQRPQGISGNVHGRIKLGSGGQKSIAQILWKNVKKTVLLTLKLKQQPESKNVAWKMFLKSNLLLQLRKKIGVGGPPPTGSGARRPRGLNRPKPIWNWLGVPKTWLKLKT